MVLALLALLGKELESGQRDRVMSEANGLTESCSLPFRRLLAPPRPAMSIGIGSPLACIDSILESMRQRLGGKYEAGLPSP